MLAPLADNGGSTLTHALLPGSPAIDAGDCNVTIGPLVEVDQRCAPRPVGAACDIGAFEHVSLTIADGDVTALFDAINFANAVPGQTIVLAEGGTYTLTDPYSGNDGLPPITGAVTINGNGAMIERSGAPGGGTPKFRILRNIGDLTLVDLTIAGGDVTDDGGGIWNSGSLDLVSCAVIENASGNQGGGIYNAGDLSALDTTLSDNPAASHGGGMFNIAAAELLNCTIAGNTADSSSNSGAGGGMRNDGWMSLVNCTVSGNSAHHSGGGIRNLQDATLIAMHVTISNNSLSNTFFGAGVHDTDGFVTLSNSIVAGNSGGEAEISGNYTDAGFNFIGDKDGDPMLGPLADNGGPTDTHALLPGSPAIDAGDCDDGEVEFDQGGVARPQGAACDIGSFEFDGSPCPADLTGSGSVGVPDLLELLACWGTVAPGSDCEAADLTDSGSVGVPDLLQLLANWGPCQ